MADEWAGVPGNEAPSTDTISMTAPAAKLRKPKLVECSVFAQYRDAPGPSPAKEPPVSPPPAVPQFHSPQPPRVADFGEEGDAWGERVISETYVAVPATDDRPQGIQAPITYDEARAFFFNSDWRSREVRKPQAHIGALAKLATPSLDKRLHEERQFVYYIQRQPMDHAVPEHARVFTTLYKFLTGETTAVPVTGGHIQKIGFQGTDPRTDLRTAGMFSLLQALYFVSKHPELAKEYYAISVSATHEFPWILCSINFSCMVLDLVKEKRLHRVANQMGSLLAAADAVYVGLFRQFVALWTSKPQRSIAEWDSARTALKEMAKENPQRLAGASSG
eukprot:EG_transcript_14375